KPERAKVVVALRGNAKSRATGDRCAGTGGGTVGPVAEECRLAEGLVRRQVGGADRAALMTVTAGDGEPEAGKRDRRGLQKRLREDASVKVFVVVDVHVGWNDIVRRAVEDTESVAECSEPEVAAYLRAEVTVRYQIAW